MCNQLTRRLHSIAIEIERILTFFEPHHITSLHITSHHITSHHITLCSLIIQPPCGWKAELRWFNLAQATWDASSCWSIQSLQQQRVTEDLINKRLRHGYFSLNKHAAQTWKFWPLRMETTDLARKTSCKTALSLCIGFSFLNHA